MGSVKLYEIWSDGWSTICFYWLISSKVLLFIISTSFNVINLQKSCLFHIFFAEKGRLVFFKKSFAIEAYSLWSFASFQKARIKINKAVPCWFFPTYARWRRTWIHCWTKCYLRCNGHFWQHVGSTSGLMAGWWQIWMEKSTSKHCRYNSFVLQEGETPQTFFNSISWALGHRGPDEFRESPLTKHSRSTEPRRFSQTYCWWRKSCTS